MNACTDLHIHAICVKVDVCLRTYLPDRWFLAPGTVHEVRYDGVVLVGSMGAGTNVDDSDVDLVTVFSFRGPAVPEDLPLARLVRDAANHLPARIQDPAMHPLGEEITVLEWEDGTDKDTKRRAVATLVSSGLKEADARVAWEKKDHDQSIADSINHVLEHENFSRSLADVDLEVGVSPTEGNIDQLLARAHSASLNIARTTMMRALPPEAVGAIKQVRRSFACQGAVSHVCLACLRVHGGVCVREHARRATLILDLSKTACA